MIPGIVPARWVLPLWPIKFDQIIFVNWLDVEVPAKKSVPIVEKLSSWRNREVYRHISSWDWTAKMYAWPVKVENVQFGRAH